MRGFVQFSAMLAVVTSPASAATEDWVHFHSVGKQSRSFEYYYDRTTVWSGGGKVLVWLKVLGSSPKALTMHLMQIDCRGATYTEKSTTITNDEGDVTLTPQSELWVDRGIAPGTSGEKLMATFCT